MWRNYILGLVKKHDANGVKYITFRKKKPSWKEYSIYIEFDNGKRYEAKKTEDPYLIAFAKDYMLVQIEKAILHWLIFGDIVHLIIKPETGEKEFLVALLTLTKE